MSTEEEEQPTPSKEYEPFENIPQPPTILEDFLEYLANYFSGVLDPLPDYTTLLLDVLAVTSFDQLFKIFFTMDISALKACYQNHGWKSYAMTFVEICSILAFILDIAEVREHQPDYRVFYTDYLDQRGDTK